MPVSRTSATTTKLQPRDVEILLAGPWAAGLGLSSPAVQHDRLRVLWVNHEADIRAEAVRRGIDSIWFLERDELVTLVRGE